VRRWCSTPKLPCSSAAAANTAAAAASTAATAAASAGASAGAGTVANTGANTDSTFQEVQDESKGGGRKSEGWCFNRGYYGNTRGYHGNINTIFRERWC